MSLGPQTRPAAPMAAAPATPAPAAADDEPAPRPEPPLVEIDLSGRSPRVADEAAGSTVAADGDVGRPTS